MSLTMNNRIKSIRKFISDSTKKANAKGVIFGLSGGIDSTVIAYLVHDIPEIEKFALIMPNKGITPNHETNDGLSTARKLNIPFKIIPINKIIFGYFSNTKNLDQRALGNLSARIRANLLYFYANSMNYLVIGTDDRSESLIGYFTKFGDGACDILPIVSYYKTEVRELGQILGVPKKIIQKKSSPNLWSNHLAEKELGMTYDEIDKILKLIIDKKIPVKTICKKFDSRMVKRVEELYKNSMHKRRLPKPFHEN